MLSPLRFLAAVFFFLSGPPTFGQELAISSLSGAPGEIIAMEMSLNSPVEQAPAAVKWVMVFPARLLDLEGAGPEIGSAAKESGKSLTCAGREPYSYVCILAGGQLPIASGPIAIFRFKIRADARSGSALVTIDNVDAVTKDLKTLKLMGAEASVTVH